MLEVWKGDIRESMNPSKLTRIYGWFSSFWKGAVTICTPAEVQHPHWKVSTCRHCRDFMATRGCLLILNSWKTLNRGHISLQGLLNKGTPNCNIPPNSRRPSVEWISGRFDCAESKTETKLFFNLLGFIDFHTSPFQIPCIGFIEENPQEYSFITEASLSCFPFLKCGLSSRLALALVSFQRAKSIGIHESSRE